MDEKDITIAQIPRSQFHARSRLYYYQGNFYHPLEMTRETASRVKNLINLFMKQNKEMIKRDRSHPDYKAMVQLFDEQMGDINCVVN